MHDAVGSGTLLNVEVVYADPDVEALIDVNVPVGTTVAEAITASAIAGRCPGVDFDHAAVGIWGKPVGRDHQLQDGDRIEVYRPLAMDPREARRQRARHGLAMGQKTDDADGDPGKDGSA